MLAREKIFISLGTSSVEIGTQHLLALWVWSPLQVRVAKVERKSAYARLESSSARRLLRLTWSIPGKQWAQEEGVRLYFEADGLDSFCKALEKNDVDQLPTDMPLGWRHA